MDYKIIQLQSKLEENKRRIEQGKANNQLLNQLSEDLKYVERLLQYFSSKRDQIKNTTKVANVMMSIYRGSAVSILQDEIKAILDMIFPDEDFIPKIKYDSRGGESRAELLIGKYSPLTNSVEYGHPANMNGGMVKQLITASATAAINILTGSPILLLDEAFCSGDGRSQAELQPFINSLVSRGIQIILVEHSKEFCEGLPRWEINLQKTRSTGEVHVIDSEYKDMPSDISKILRQMNVIDNTAGGAFAKAAAAYSDKMRIERMKQDQADNEQRMIEEAMGVPQSVATADQINQLYKSDMSDRLSNLDESDLEESFGELIAPDSKQSEEIKAKVSEDIKQVASDLISGLDDFDNVDSPNVDLGAGVNTAGSNGSAVGVNLDDALGDLLLGLDDLM